MLAACRDELDMVYVSTPHALHGAQAVAVTEAGLDLFLEKPMVTTVAEAKALIAAQALAQNLIVVAFNGGLSPLVRDTKARIEKGEFGALVSVAGSIWEGWSEAYNGGWKQNPALSGGGFMFDTGAHMMNTICQLLDADFERVSAYMNNRGKPVDITCAVSARTKSGVLVTLNAAGEGPKGCFSHMTLFFQKAIVRIDAWGGSGEMGAGGGRDHRQPAEDLPGGPPGRDRQPLDHPERSAFRPSVGCDKAIRGARRRIGADRGLRERHEQADHLERACPAGRGVIGHRLTCLHR